MVTNNQELFYEAIDQLKVATGNKTIVIDDINQTIDINGIRFGCIIKKTINNANIFSAIDAIQKEGMLKNTPMILIASKIYPKQANLLAESHIGWIDKAGNCDISHKGLIMKVVGRKNNTDTKKTAPSKVSETSIKLVLFFLQEPDSVNLSYRKIQEKTGFSLGAITKVFDILKTNNYLVQTDKGRKIAMREELIDWWQQKYNEFLKPKLLVSRMTFRSLEARKNWKKSELPQGVYWGGDCGAHILDGYLIPGDFELYSNIISAQLLRTGLLVPDPQGEIKIYKKFWIGESEGQAAPALVIYADLMGTGDSRCREAALRIKEHGI